MGDEMPVKMFSNVRVLACQLHQKSIANK